MTKNILRALLLAVVAACGVSVGIAQPHFSAAAGTHFAAAIPADDLVDLNSASLDQLNSNAGQRHCASIAACAPCSRAVRKLRL